MGGGAAPSALVVGRAAADSAPSAAMPSRGEREEDDEAYEYEERSGAAASGGGSDDGFSGSDVDNEGDDDDASGSGSDGSEDDDESGYAYAGAAGGADSARGARAAFSVLDEAGIRARQQEAVSGVVAVLRCAPDEAVLLLRHYKWSASRVHEEWFQARRARALFARRSLPRFLSLVQALRKREWMAVRGGRLNAILPDEGK
jgi:hypothetical protein